MASYIVKAKNLDLKKANNKVSIGRFYSGDRFYTLLSEYIDVNLHKKSKLMAWIIKILFKSSNYKHDPGIANGQPWSVKLFDWFCIMCLIIFIILTLGVIGTLIPVIMGFVSSKIDAAAMDSLKAALLGIGIPAICFGIPAILWLVIFFTIRKKNKPLSLQAYVEKKISFCLKLRFLIKNSPHFKNDADAEVMMMENFEAQGAAGPRWLNVQMINLVCSIFPEFNYVFRFEELSDADAEELQPIFDYDFRMLSLVKTEDDKWNSWQNNERKTFFTKSNNKSETTKTQEVKKEEVKENKKEDTSK